MKPAQLIAGLVATAAAATLLLDLAALHLGDNMLQRFAFRGLSPAICGDPLHLVLRRDDDTIALAAFAADGRQVMAATAN